MGDGWPSGDLEDLPHIHALMLVHPDVAHTFRAILHNGPLDQLLGKFRVGVRDVHVQLVRARDIKHVVGYCAKYLKRSGGSVHSGNLYHVWPRSISEGRFQERPAEERASARIIDGDNSGYITWEAHRTVQKNEVRQILPPSV